MNGDPIFLFHFSIKYKIKFIYRKIKRNLTLTLSPMSPGLPGFTLQTADEESRFTGIGIPLLCFPLKTVQTWVIFLWWIPGWKCKHDASVCWKPCQNQRKFTEFTRIWNEGTFFLKEYGRIEAKLVYFFDIKCRFMFKTLGMDIVQCEEFVQPHKIFQNFAVLG